MAQLVVAAAGAALGGALIPAGFLGLSGAAIGWTAGSLLGSALVKTPNQEGPRLGDLRVAGTEYGQPIPWVAGSPRIAGQIAWASNRREIANTQKVGKGGGGQRVTTYTYEVDLLIVLTENPIASVSRIWSNGELVYQGNGNVTKSGVWANLTVYTGEDDQLPDPIYESAVGAGNAPAYRGRGYVVIQSLQLGQGGQIPNLTFEVNNPVNGDPFIDDVILYARYDDTFDCIVTGKVGTSVLGASLDSFGLFGGSLTMPEPTSNRACVSYAANADFLIGTVFTIDVSFFVDSVKYSSVTSNPAIITFNASTGPGINLILQNVSFINKTARIRFGNFESDAIAASAATQINMDQWYRIRVTRDLSNVVRLYIDGQKVAENTYSSGLGRSDAALLVGGNTSASTRFPGFIDEVRITSGAARTTGDSYQDWAEGPFPTVYAALPGFAIDGKTSTLFSTSTELMLRSGYEADDFDLDDLNTLNEKPMRAFSIGQISSTRSALEVLQKGWYFEASKSDKIYVRPRPLTPIVTIPYEDLGTGEDASNGQEPLALQIGSDIEVPGQVALSYNNISADFNISTEYSDRLISSQQTTATVQMPIGFTPEEAKGVVDALLMDQVAGLTSTTIRLPLKYAYIEPGDVINAVNFDARTYRLRVNTKRDTLSIIELDCVLDDVGALDSAAITSTDYISTLEPNRIAPTIFQAMDIPILRDADDEPGYYAAVAADKTSADDEWPGAVYVQAFSPDAYQQEFTTGESCIMGDALGTLGNWSGGNVWDETNTLDVEVLGELVSSTKTLMINDLSINVMLVGDEIIRYRLATFLSTLDGRNTYRLSSLLRGQRGTEWAIGLHGSGEKVVGLNNAIRRVPGLLTQIGLERDVKAVTLNTLLSDVADVPFTDTAVGLKPFSVANLNALADGSDLEVTWQRRTRLAVRYGGTVDQVVPLGEIGENYRVQIFNGSTLVRTETVTQPSYTYPAADIAADGFTTGDPVTVVVAQLSATVGAGYESETIGIAP